MTKMGGRYVINEKGERVLVARTEAVESTAPEKEREPDTETETEATSEVNGDES